MRLILVIMTAALAIVPAFSQQRPETLVSREIRGEDWAISDWSAVRLGQLSVSHSPAGDELHVYTLSPVPRPLPPDRVHSTSPACDGNCYLISSFDHGNRNGLGGYFNSFAGPPSTARATLQRWDDGRRALTLDFARAGSGYCGMWIHFFDSKRPAAERVYLDTTPYSVLTIWVRGQKGNERLLLKAADALWERKEDALPVGEVGSFLPNGRIENSWQQAVVPLSTLPRRLSRRDLAALVLEVVGVGDGQVAVKDLAFCKSREPLPLLSPPAQPAVAERSAEKALWVWNTAAIMNSPKEQRALVDFARRAEFSHLFLQLPNDQGSLGAAGEIVLDAARWKSFLTLLNQNGLRAYALDGFENYALPEYHERVLKTVDNVVRYNQSVEPGQRWYGIHYDIEPYLIPGFQGTRRQRILASFLELLEKMALRTRAAGMIFGVDIPFWYDSPDELTGQVFLLEFKGARKNASDHVTDLADHIAVMDYRTFAYGADGVVGLAEGELAYAATRGKKVFVGLETNALPDEELIEFEGEPGHGLPEQPPAERCVVIDAGSAAGTVWMVPRSRWSDLRRRLQVGTPSPSPLLWWPVRKVVPVPAGKLTFASLGADRFHQTMLEAQEELARYSSFAGFAVHDYAGYRKLLDASASFPKSK